MSCSHAWDELFIRNTFPKSWVEKQYKDHRKASIIDQEKSYLAESMPYVPAYKEMMLQATEQKEMEEKHHDEIKALESQIAKLTIDLRDESVYKKRTKEAVAKRNILKDGLFSAKHQLYVIQGEIKGAKWQTQRRKEEVNQSVRERAPVSLTRDAKVYNTPCMDKNCRGFFDAQWKCGLCNKQVCKHCREDITNKSHVCDPNTVASIKAMYNDAVPCPKCKEPISRVSGCSHMFCTWCNTGFDYKTGEIIDASRNTNPHFYRWQAQQQQRPQVQNARQAHAIQIDACTTPAQLVTIIENKLRRVHNNNSYRNPAWNYCHSVHAFCFNILSLIGECTSQPVQPYGPSHNRMSRVKYLSGTHGEKELARDAMKEYKRVMYDIELTQLKDMLRTTLSDWLRDLAQYVDTQYTINTNLFKQPIMSIPKELVDYYNTEALKLAKAFDYSCYQKATERQSNRRMRAVKNVDPLMDVIKVTDDISQILTLNVEQSKINAEYIPQGWSIISAKI